MPIRLFMLLGLLGVIWGGSFFFIKILVGSFEPWSVAFLRCLFGTITLGLILSYRKEKLNINLLPWKFLIIVGLLNTSIPWTLISYSQLTIDSTLAAVLNASTPIWTLIIGMLFFRLTINRYQLLGISCGFIGILILIDLDWSSMQMGQFSGIVAMLVVTLSYACATQLSWHHFSAISVYQISFVTLFAGTISSGMMATFTESLPWNQVLAPINFGSLIGLGVLGSGIAYILFFQLVQKGSAQFASLVTYLVPPFAILWGYTLLQEKISVTLFVGLAFILLGVFVSSRKGREKVASKQVETI